MKEKTVKKMIMAAEGFGYNDSLEAFYSQGSTWTHFKQIQAWEFYPILLYRAVQGWNKKRDHIILSGNDVFCWLLESPYWHSYYKKTEYLTPQEQAIEACLIELLEGK